MASNGSASGPTAMVECALPRVRPLWETGQRRLEVIANTILSIAGAIL